MGGQVVHDQRHPLSLRVALVEQMAHAFGPLDTGVVVGHRHAAPILQRRVEQQQVAHPVAFVLAVVAFGVVRGGLDRFAHLLRALLGRFVHADQRPTRIEWALVDVEHTLHLAHEGGVLSCLDAPHLTPPGLDGLFLKLVVPSRAPPIPPLAARPVARRAGEASSERGLRGLRSKRAAPGTPRRRHPGARYAHVRVAFSAAPVPARRARTGSGFVRRCVA